jgi:hypothetical protein
MPSRPLDTTDLLPVVRACDLDEPPDHQRWLVESLWARAGVGIIGGAPKCCKSWLALDLALSVASSTPCLGRFQVLDPGPALVFFAEDPPGVVRQRLSALTGQRALDLARVPLHVITASGLRLDLDRDQRRLDRTLAALQPRLLLLDPFVRLHRINENDAGEVSRVLAFLRQLQRQHDVAVIVVHHTRKNGPAGVQAGQGLRGSSDFHAWTDSALYLRRKRDQLLLTIEHRAAPAPPPLALALATSPDGTAYLEIVDPTGDPPADPDLPQRILDALDQLGGPATRDSLRTSLRVRNERLGPALHALAAAGDILRTAQGWIRPTVPVPTIDSRAERNAPLLLPLG